MSFDLKQIRAFEAVARCGGFSRASRDVGLTQPTLSTHISNLESSIGVRLFDRGSRKVFLTPAGELFVQYARRMLDLYEESVEAIDAFSGKVRGSVRVYASTVPGEYILPGWLVQFYNLYPEVQVTLTVSQSATVLDAVKQGEAAIGVAGASESHPSLESSLLCDDDVVLVAAPGWKGRQTVRSLTPAELARLPLVRREAGSGTQLALENALRREGHDPGTFNWAATLGSTRAVIEGVLAGLGGAFVSRKTVVREINGGSLDEIAVHGLGIERGIYVVRNNSKTLSPAASCLLEELLRSGPGVAAGMKMTSK